MILFALMFACGAFTKFTDNLIDEPFKSRFPKMRYATGILYGLIAGFLIASSPEFATLIIAIAIGVLLSGKIDSRAHQLAIAAIFVAITFLGLPPVNFFALALFSGLGFLDELLNDFVDRLREKGRHINKALEKAVSARLSLEFGTLTFGLATGNYVYFIAMLSFDLAYNLVDKAMPFFMARFNPEYGPQLAIDLYKCSEKKLGKKAFVKRFLNGFPAKIGMRKISKAFVLEHRPEKEEDSGLSGLVIIAESHVTIHTYPLRQLAKIDIVSCKAFDQEKAVSILKKAFNAREAEVQSLYRGKHYPKDAKKASVLMQEERRRR